MNTKNAVANRIIEFLPDGTFIDKMTTYDEYLESDESNIKDYSNKTVCYSLENVIQLNK